MPIKRLQRDTASFPRIGKLRKGAAKPQNGNAPGKDLEYFRFDTDDAEANERFVEAYGNMPKKINVYLPFETVEENFSTWQEAYVAGGLKHRCDGETCVIWQKPDGTYSQEPIPCPGGCKEVGRLNVIIPELARLAYVTAETHSINDILNLTDNLEAALALRGSLTGIPFVLSRRPVEISTPSDGKRVRRTKWLLFLEPHPDWVRVQLATMRHNALTMAADGLALPEHRQLAVGATGPTVNGQAVDLDTGEVMDDDDLDIDGMIADIPGAEVVEENPFVEAPAKPVPTPASAAPTDYPADWRGPVDAQMWAVTSGHCANDHEARNSWVNTVKEHKGFDKNNAAQVYAAFYAKHMQRESQAA